MFAAFIENGTVTQVSKPAPGQQLPAGWVASETRVGIGWSYADGVFSPPPTPEPVVTVPTSISKVQFVRAARASGLWATYQAAIEAHPDWPYVTEIPRNDPIVQAMASQLGFTEEQLDALWIAGASL